MPNIRGWLAQGVGELPEMGGELRIRDGPDGRERWWRVATLGVAWLAVVLTYAMAVIGFSRRPFGYALTQGVISVTLAAMLGYGVWRITKRVAWEDRRRVRFLVAHVALAAAYAVLWVAVDYVVTSSIRGSDLLASLARMNLRFLALDLALGVLLYGLIIGASYSARAQERYREQAAAAARAEALAARAQLDALRAQLNPHFLFNALHSLAPLVRESPALAEDALNRLGDLLRYALDDGMSGDVAFGDEWQFAQDYLALEKLRLGSRLNVRTNIDPDVLDVPVPSFILQPVVENAIRHGIAPRPRGGTVSIEARSTNSRLTISVSDDGMGTSMSHLAGATGLGLRALRQRLASRYAGEAAMAIDARTGLGFAVRLSIPIEHEAALVPSDASA